MIRLALECDDRLGVTQEVLSILVDNAINLRGIELAEQLLYLKLNASESAAIDKVLLQLHQVEGIHSVKRIDLLPGEREHQELTTLLACYPESLVSVAKNGDILAASESFYDAFQLSGIPNLSIVDRVLTEQQLYSIFESLEQDGFTQLSIVIADKPLLIEAFPIYQNDERQLKNDCKAAVLLFKAPSQVAEQLERWQRSKDLSFDQIVAQSETMKMLLQEAEQTALLDAPLLIEGETGTGKELVARATHLKRTPGKPFLAINCASLPDSSAEHELFGYSGNAFEGASKAGKPGLLELADGGTLYFDEIDEMSPYLQVKLLRFLEEGAFRRVGTDDEVRVNVKVIASTQSDLRQLCENNQFRQDLYYRLHVLNLKIPALRQRVEDIQPLAEYFLAHGCQRMGRSACQLTQRALLTLTRYNWPGNVRELENIIFRALSLTTSTSISNRHLNMPMLKVTSAEFVSDADAASHRQLMQTFEKELFQFLYPSFPSSRKLAKRLGLSHTAVANKLKQYKLSE